ncbi:C-type lectin 37Da-like [Sitodiplosis mosellana]|uniref:C-type lectin 37Da-like n=1 Tax=Sitodiplosis mosellana TaxID=263140 RepID=UPI002444838C|nr:C-type lectin 37Da-like [Sitodiplosis mosellana]
MKLLLMWIFIVLVLALAQASPQLLQQPQASQFAPFTPSSCPQQNYYFNRKVHSTWFEAKDRCANMGMQLATIDTREKYFHLRMQLNDLDFGDGFWAYGTSMGRGTFYWPATKQEFTFADWGPNQPDHYGGNEDCLDFRKYDGQYRYNDLNCNNRQGFVCEYPLPNMTKMIFP